MTGTPSISSVCLLVLALLAGVLPGLAAGENATENALEKGVEHLAVGEYDMAVEHFKTVVDAGGPVGGAGRVAALRGWADALVATGKPGEALALLQSGDGFNESAALLARAGRVYLRTGAPGKARELLGKAVGLAPHSPEALYHLGEAHRQSGDLEKAGEIFRRALDAYRDLDPDTAETLAPEDFVYWGLVCIRLNRYRDADEVMFSQAEQIDPKNLALLLAWAWIMQDKYNYPDSRSFCRDAIDRNPDFADGLAALAANYMVDFQVGTKRFDQAEKYLDRALEVDPRNSLAHQVRGRIWLYDGRLARAAEHLQKAIECNPANMAARGLLAATYHVLGDRAAFEKAEKEALAINPRAAEFYHTVAVAIEKKFRYPDAVRMCDRALKLDPDYWPAYVTLGINCLRTGENVRGRSFLEKSWKHDRYNVWVANTRDLLKHIDRDFVSFKNDNFIFYLPRADAPFMRPYLEPLLQEAHRSLSRRYNVTIDGPIQIESFSKHQWFSARTVGLPGFAASGACFGKLVTLTTPRALPQNWGAVAWHEFAHVVTIQLTDFRVPRWLTEGVSVYEEGHDRPHWARNFQREIADAWGSGRLLPMDQLKHGFSKPKFPMQILLSYYQGCLIVQFISQRWDFDAVLKILDGYKNYKSTATVLREVLGTDVETFDRDFGRYVEAWVQKNGYAPAVAEEMVVPLELRRDRSPEDVSVLCNLAWAYFCKARQERDGSFIDASLVAGKALQIDPKSGDAHAILGMVRFHEKKRRAARENLEEARGLGTRFAFRVLALLGNLALSAKDRAGAIELYEEAKKISPIAGAGFPAQGNIYYKLATHYEQIGKPEAAIRQMEELARFATEDQECRLRLVQYALEKEDWKTAARYLDELVYINPFDMNFHRYYARAASELDDHDVVIRETRILLLDPATNSLEAHLALARAHAGKGELGSAAAEARKVLDIDPENVAAKEILERQP